VAHGGLGLRWGSAPRRENESAGSRARRRARWQRLVKSERGTAVVEFALVVLPLTLIVFGILDFGRALNYYNDLTQLSGQGARALAVDQNVDGTVADSNFQTLLAAEADSPELKNQPVKVCVSAPNGWPPKNGDPINVTTSYQFKFIPLVHPISITLTASQTERWEGLDLDTTTSTLTDGCVP
jgi:Flp pilus assembly protein TadG